MWEIPLNNSIYLSELETHSNLEVYVVVLPFCYWPATGKAEHMCVSVSAVLSTADLQHLAT